MRIEDGHVAAPYAIICEGSADRAFITRLLQARWGVTDISVRCTHQKGERGCGGRDALTESLRALDAVRSTIPGAVRGIAIVFDSDDEPQKSFEAIINSIKAAKLSYPLPAKPLEVMPSTTSAPSIAIALLPWVDRTGHLDELIFESLRESHRDLLQPIDDFQAATNHRTGHWKAGKKSKMRLRCMIAASHEPDPSLALSFLLESSSCPVDFYHPSFNQLTDFLEDFRSKA
jgi:hypothetical protein